MPRAESTPSGEDDLIAGFGDLRPNEMLGPYELLLPAGRGGMALVWLARAGDGRRVALKTMLPALSADPRFEKMFLAEAKLASRIEHPNVCEVLDVGEDRGRLYLVMEWISGDSLAALARHAGGPIPYGVAARIALDIARGLAAAHALTDEDGRPLDVVHRDVSPQNIMVRDDGVAKVVDFGVSKAASGEGLTQSGYTKGKVLYMSPEQAFAEKVDCRTDIFALGVVLYEATLARHPFAGPTQLATLSNVATAEPPSPRELAADYPPALADIVLRALQKERDERFQSMGELAEALALVVASLAGSDHVDVAALVARVGAASGAKSRAEAMGRALARAEKRPRLLVVKPARAHEPPAQRSRLVALLAIGGAVAVGAVVTVWLAQRAPAETRPQAITPALDVQAAATPPASTAPVPADPPRPALAESAAPEPRASALPPPRRTDMRPGAPSPAAAPPTTSTPKRSPTELMKTRD